MVDAPKYIQVAEELERKITDGIWGKQVPSVRAIAKEYSVSIVTASRALQVLCDKKLVQTVERSGAYVIDRETSRQKLALVLRITPGPWHEASVRVAHSGFDGLDGNLGVRFLNDAIAWPDDATAADLDRGVRKAKDAGVEGIVFLPSRTGEHRLQQDETFLRACDEHNLPTILYQRNLPGDRRPLERDLVSSDDLEAGRAVTRHLLELGRRRIAFVAASAVSSHFDRVAGYMHELSRFDAEKPLTPTVLRQSATLPFREACMELAERLIDMKADGVVCYQDYVAMGIILECFKRGVRVPEQLAVVGFDNLPVGNVFSFGVSTYEFPVAELARQCVRSLRHRIEESTRPPVRVLVPGRLLARESSQAS
jgi:LacI family transcriptional regulator